MTSFSRNLQGLLWCMTFVLLDSAQAVYLGGVLQNQDSFLLGAIVFGSSSIGCLIWTQWKQPEQIKLALRNPGPLLGLNITATTAWLAYFLAIQLIEPAVAFTLFIGAIPLTIILASYFKFPEAQATRNSWETFGNLIIILGLTLLCVFTLTGQSGFVRGGTLAALTGLSLSFISGAFIAFMLLYSRRLDTAGLTPVAQTGFRFPLFLICALIGVAFGVDYKGPIILEELLIASAIGMLILAFPIYAVQKAVSLTTALTIGSLSALAPLIVFLMQLVEKRVDYSEATMIGLTIYFLGAIITAIGSTKTLKPEEAS